MNVWDIVAMQPMINSLIALSHYLSGNVGLAIIVLTIVIRLAMLPLTLKQLHATKALQALQPKMAEIQKKYARDRQKLAQEQMRLYREAKMSPAGCLVPMVVQMPIWFALYWTISKVLAVTPEDFLGLSQYLYSWPVSYSSLPLQSQFLWLNLATPDRYLLLPIVVGVSMWVQQKMVTPPSADPQQSAQSRMMLWTMPLMFGIFTLYVSSGLALYWLVSNIVSVVVQYFVTGWGALAPTKGKPAKEKKPGKAIAEVEAPAVTVSAEAVETGKKEELGYGRTGDKREDRRGIYPARPKTVRRNPRAGRGHRPKRR